MTLAWQFLAQRGSRPLRPGAAPTDAPQPWCLRELYRTQYGSAILDEATVQVLAPYAPIVEVVNDPKCEQVLTRRMSNCPQS